MISIKIKTINQIPKKLFIINGRDCTKIFNNNKAKSLFLRVNHLSFLRLMSFINSVVSWYLKKRISQIEYFISNPFEVQEDILQKLLTFAEDTEFGKKYDFASIKTYEDFKNRLPLQSYEEVKHYIDRLRKGENNLIWPTEIKWFAKSSGTTSDKSKFIPVSDESLEDCHFKGGRDVLAFYTHNRPDNKMFTGKGLVLGGSHKVSEFNNKAYFGDLSAILLQNFPSWGEFFRTPNLSLVLLDNWEEKLEKIANFTKKENVTNISGVPSWNLVLLKKILEITGRNNILEVWPNLELFIHGGVSFVPYREQFQKMIPSERMYYLETYNASEGFFGIQDRPCNNEMMLMLDYGIFYEFIPLDEFDKENPKVVTLENVQMGTNYALVITTNGGLWRYVIGDTIMFTSLAPFRIIISGRTKNFINAFGEEVIIDNADKAIDAACKATGAIISEYTAAPVFLKDNESAAHEYLIEFETEPNNLKNFIEILDKQLQSLNSDYEAKRSSNLMLSLPIVHAVPQGTFFRWLKSKGKMGGQNKVPRLYNDRKYVEEILNFMKE